MERGTPSSPLAPAEGARGGQNRERGNGGGGSGRHQEREQQGDRKFFPYHSIYGHDISECRDRFKHQLPLQQQQPQPQQQQQQKQYSGYRESSGWSDTPQQHHGACDGRS